MILRERMSKFYTPYKKEVLNFNGKNALCVETHVL